MDKHPQCFNCGADYREKVMDYKTQSPDGPIVVPAVLFLVCDKCGDECIPPESSKKIERWRWG